MIRSLLAPCVFGATLLASPAMPAAQRTPAPFEQDHVAWAGGVLTRMQTIRVGMTRGDLLKVFTVEGGLSTRTHRTFVSRDCPYFKVDVDFRAVDSPRRREPVEADRDVIVRISRPYLQLSIMD